MTASGSYDALRNPLCRRPAGEHDESCNCGRDGYIVPVGRDVVRNSSLIEQFEAEHPEAMAQARAEQDRTRPRRERKAEPCSRAHVVPDGQDCPEHADVAAEIASYGVSGYLNVRNPLHGVSDADVRDYLQPCDHTHVIPAGQSCKFCEQQRVEYRVRCADGVERHSSYWTDADEQAQFEFTFSACGPHDCARRCVTYGRWVNV